MLRRTVFVGATFGAVLALGLPFVGGGGPSLGSPAYASVAEQRPVAASSSVESRTVGDVVSQAASEFRVVRAERDLTVDTEHLAQKPVPEPQADQTVTPEATGSGTSGRSGGQSSGGQSSGGQPSGGESSGEAPSSGGGQVASAETSTGQVAAVSSCPSAVGGSVSGAPGITSAGGVGGTTTADLQSFASEYNAIRVANCLEPVPMANFRYDSCMEARLFWIAEDPSPDVNSAWGHSGTPRSDGVAEVGCDGNLAGGSGNTGATVAQKWWNSASHQKSLYRPTFTGSISGVVICFAMVHGGLPNDGAGFARAAARWGGC